MDGRYFPLNIDLLFYTHILSLRAKANLKNVRDAFTLIFCAFRYKELNITLEVIYRATGRICNSLGGGGLSYRLTGLCIC